MQISQISIPHKIKLIMRFIKFSIAFGTKISEVCVNTTINKM